MKNIFRKTLISVVCLAAVTIAQGKEVTPGNRPEGPGGAKGGVGAWTVGGKDGRDTELGEHLNETAAGSEIGARRAGAGVHDACSSPGPRVDARGLPAYAQRRRTGRGRTDRGAVQGAPGGKPPESP